MEFFSDSTLFYFFSTLAQVLAAIVALIAVLVHFRINALRDFLVGDGKATLERNERGEKAYELDDKSKNRLIDSVGRNDIGGIKIIIKLLAEREKKEGITLEDRKRGLQFVYNKFLVTEKQIDKMVRMSKKAFIWALGTALYSVIASLFIDLISGCFSLQIALIAINIILLIICGNYIAKGMSLSFKNFKTRSNSVE